MMIPSSPHSRNFNSIFFTINYFHYIRSKYILSIHLILYHVIIIISLLKNLYQNNLFIFKNKKILIRTLLISWNYRYNHALFIVQEINESSPDPNRHPLKIRKEVSRKKKDSAVTRAIEQEREGDRNLITTLDLFNHHPRFTASCMVA